jgi:NAD(P)-dependent dehydrogenase (short-subunit alcohol dehydrogenase family)
MMTSHVLITGANRGIGLAFVRHYLRAGWIVFAGCRRPADAEALHKLQAEYPAHLTPVELDISQDASIQSARQTIASYTQKLDLLINNAAVFVETTLGELTFETSMHVLRVNAVGPVMVTQAFFDLLKAADRGIIVSIASNRASISEKTDTKLYDYSASKAALNMYTRSLAANAKAHNMMAIMIDPGWVQTRMGGDDAALAPAETVTGMTDLIDNLTPEQNGYFYNYDGTRHAW